MDDSRPAPLRRLWHYGGPYRRRTVVATVYSVLNKLFDLAPPLLIGLAVDIVVTEEGNSWMASLGPDSQRGQLVTLAFISFAIWVLESLFEFLYRVAWRNLAQDIEHDLRLDAYRTTQQLDHRWFESRSTGDLLAALNDDVNQLERFLDIGASELIQVTTTVITISAVFFVLAPTVAWWSLLPIPFILWGSIWFQRKLEPRYAEVRNQAGFLNGQLTNNLLGISTIKSFVAEEREVDRIAAESDNYREANRRAITLSSAFTPLIRMAILVGFTGTLIFGGFLAIEGTSLSVGAYSVMVYLTQRLLWPLTRLGETFDQYQRAMASTNRVLDLVDTDTAIVSGPEPIVVARGDGHLRFEGVTFAYDEAGPVIDDLTLDIPPGATTAIVGPTGGGKSTLIKLLLRFYDPDEGRITLEGWDLQDLDLGSLRAASGLVSQDVYLFHGSVRANIAYGKPYATEDEIVAAAKVAEAHDFVTSLPDGYDTVVGERGQKLSGGQRQRVSIARAVLKDPPILLLDEATSAVDNETEASIQRSLERISQGRTTIVIAHRLSTIRRADIIHVLSNGRIVESGVHDDLVALDGAYAALWRVQTGEALRH
ncbi:MAG: ABC transporter ATP-binding protein/permease [Acidimicrobiia bacterium]|nr:ABC transporter ATP-binding protein/permease [Acidimicrobiia bacterium]